MRIQARTGRPALTLMEVLISIFIAGIGLIAILALFPMAALNMNQAIKDQRAADSARNAAAIARLWNIPYDSNLFNLPTVSTAYLQGAPVYVDPIGATLSSSVGGSSGIPRCGLSTISSTQAHRWMTLLDEMTYYPSGNVGSAGGFVERSPRYSWCYMCQMPGPVTGTVTTTPAVGAPAPTGVTPYPNVTVVVYDRRNPIPLGSGLAEETLCTATFNSSTTTATLNWSGAPAVPNLKRGTWILDATTNPSVHGYFYRVVNVISRTPNSAVVELNQNAVASATNGVAVIMETVVEVFPKGPLCTNP